MLKKEFLLKWIEWVIKAVQGGKVNINVNGEQGASFRTYKGLRQGDPLSPLLFNLVVDALGAMLEATKEKGRIVGSVPHLIEGGVTHLQYGNGTAVMVQNNRESVLDLKFILYCFESMSGIKINYHKSEVYVLGVERARKEEIAVELNCKLDNFPMIYLGIPIHIKKLRKQDLGVVNDKMSKRIDS
jgi:hypothetical protein